jgi:hypothetical protein
MSTPSDSKKQRIEREVARERHERELHDEVRAGLAPEDDLRIKDAREHAGAVDVRRPARH